MSTAPLDAAPERPTERCALICGMKFTPLVFKLECMVFCINDWTKFHRGTARDTRDDRNLNLGSYPHQVPVVGDQR